MDRGGAVAGDRSNEGALEMEPEDALAAVTSNKADVGEDDAAAGDSETDESDGMSSGDEAAADAAWVRDQRHKVELHRHIEGSIRPETIWRWHGLLPGLCPLFCFF